MINIVCALHCEARPIIDLYKLSASSNSVFPVFSNEDMNLVVSGIGKVDTAAAMAYLFAKAAQPKTVAWLNYGIAGHKTAALGQWFNVNKITERSTSTNWYPARYQGTNQKSSALMTVDVPISEYDVDGLYDMEASSFMATALKFSSVELVQVMKIVSDNEEHHLDKIDKKYVQKLMQDNITPLIDMIELLAEKSKEFHAIYGVDSMFEECLGKWHFTQYQQKELERLVQRWKILGDKSRLEQLKKCIDAKQVIGWFKAELAQVAVEF